MKKRTPVINNEKDLIFAAFHSKDKFVQKAYNLQAQLEYYSENCLNPQYDESMKKLNNLIKKHPHVETALDKMDNL